MEKSASPLYRFFIEPPASCGALLRRLALILIPAWLIGYAIIGLFNPAIIEAVGNDGQNHKFDAQPYELATKEHHATLAVKLRYLSWQNGTVIVEPQGGCVERVGLAPPAGLGERPIATLIDVPSFCHETAINLAPVLREGLNQLVFEVAIATDYTDNADGTRIYIQPQLFGAHGISTLACLIIFAGFAYALFVIARWTGLNPATCRLLLVSFAWFALTLHIKPNLAYSNDLPGHIAYARYMVEGWWHPYGYDGWENFHPPLYYIVAGQFFHLFENTVMGPLNVLRMLGLFLYTVFCLFGLRTLAVATESRGAAYYTGVILILLWPISPIVATRISNDIAVYAAWSVAFYYLARFFEKRELPAMQLAMGFTGLAFAFKTSAITIVVTTAVCGLYALISRLITWRDLLRGRSLLAFCFLALGALGNTGKMVWHFLRGDNLSDYLSPGANEVHSAWYYLHFSPVDFIVNPTITFDHEPSFLNYFLKTLIFSEQQFDGLARILPSIMNVLLLVFIVITVTLTLKAVISRRESWERLLPYIVPVVIAPFELCAFMLAERYMFCQSFRFVLPALVPFTILFVRGMLALPDSGGARLVRGFSIFIALTLIAGGLAMYLWVYSHGQFG